MGCLGKAAIFGLMAVWLATGAWTGAMGAPRVVFLGDSLTAAFGVEPEEGYVALLQEKIERAGYPHRVANAGVSGDTSAGGLRRVDWALSQPADILFIALGGNDGLRGLPPAALADNLQGIIARARERQPDIRIILAGMRMPDSMGAEYARAFAAVYPRVAESTGVLLLPFLLEGVAGEEAMNLPDRIHPSPAGHQRVAENVWAVLEPLLK